MSGTSLKGYFTRSSFLSQNFLRFLVNACSTNASLACSFRNLRIYRGSQSSLATPRSLQHLMRAFDLQPSVAVATPSESKYCCSPRANETRLNQLANELRMVSRDSPSSDNHRIFSRDELCRDEGLSSRRKSPAPWPECLVQDASIFDLG